MSNDEHRKEGETSLPSAALNVIPQLRQISIPLWARIFAFLLAVLSLLPGIVIVLVGSLSCAPEGLLAWIGWKIACNGQLVEQGATIIAATFLPVMVVVYVVFADTGTKAIGAKTAEMLEKLVPSALRHDQTDLAGYTTDGMDECTVETKLSKGSPDALYTLSYARQTEKGTARIVVSLNVEKAVVVFLVPCRDRSRDVLELLKGTVEGALREGYLIDDAQPTIAVNGTAYTKLVARKALDSDFFWNPAKKLHFAQDLRAFVFSALTEGHELFVIERAA